jgi:hypothetical protein
MCAVLVFVGAGVLAACREPAVAVPGPPPLAAASASESASSASPPVSSFVAMAASSSPPPPHLKLEAHTPRHGSPLPTAEEWTTAREIVVEGSTPLRCETRKVREYVRILCRKLGSLGGRPTAVKLISGGRGEALTESHPGLTSLIVPYEPGSEVTAEFSWTNERQELYLSWRYDNDRTMPASLGRFKRLWPPVPQGAMSISFMGGRSITQHEMTTYEMCNCHASLFKTSCDEIAGRPNDECASTYRENCEKMLLCAMGDLYTLPTCRENQILTQPGNVCGEICEKSADCRRAGYSCVSRPDGPSICREP